MLKKYKIAYLVSHPIQYQAPLLRYLAAQPDLDLTVFFRSDLSVRPYFDDGFGKTIEWDVPLLDGYRHEFLPAFGGSNHIDFLRPFNYGLAWRLWRGRYDAIWVHGYFPLFNLYTLLAARLMGMATFVRDEATTLSKKRSRLKSTVKKFLLFGALRRTVSAWLSIGRFNAAYYRENGVSAGQIFPAPYGVDNSYFAARAAAAAPQRDSFRTELGLAPGRPVILYASKLQRRKKPDDLLAAFVRLMDDGTVGCRPYLLFVGDGEMAAELQAAAAPLGADVRFLGFRNQSQLPALFNLCDVFVLPSVDEPWGLVINEVMCAGRAVIVTDQVGCWPDLVEDGVNGYVFPAGDIAALTDRLRRLTADPGLCADMGAASRRVVAGYDFPQVVAGLRAALAATVG